MKFSVAVIYYNPTIDVLKLLENYCDIFERVLVVDNSDRPVFAIEEEVTKYKQVTYVNMNGNQGMSKALNCAFSWAIENEDDFLLTMDQDSIYEKKNIQIMIDYIEKNYSDEVGIYVANFAKLYRDKKTGNMIPDKPQIGENEVVEADMCITSTSFTNLKAIKKQLPLEDLFIAYVDNLISLNMTKNGYKMLRVGKSYFQQQVGNPVDYSWVNSKLRILHHSEVRYYYMIRNNRYFKEHCGKDVRMKVKADIGILRLIFNILFGEKKKIKKIKACIKGYSDYKKRVKGIIPKESFCW